MRSKNIIGIVILGVVFIVGFSLLRQKGQGKEVGKLSSISSDAPISTDSLPDFQDGNQNMCPLPEKGSEKSVASNKAIDNDGAKSKASEESSLSMPKDIIPKEPEKLDLEILFSLAPIEESIIYEVKPGDTLSAIASEYGTTIDLIKASNKLEGSIIKVGQRLKVIKGEFKIAIDTSYNTLSLFLDDKLVKIYPVGTAKDRNTPIGEFKIINKLIEPTWYAPEGGVYPYGDPKNIIGTRWMGIDEPGYGIHGTADPESIGKYVSQGCVRMLNEDVEELFTIVPQGTKVNIIKSKEG